MLGENWFAHKLTLSVGSSFLDKLISYLKIVYQSVADEVIQALNLLLFFLPPQLVLSMGPLRSKILYTG